MRFGVVLGLWVTTTALAQPVQAPFSVETATIPSSLAGDTAILPDRWSLQRDYAFGTDTTNGGFFGFLRDGGVGLFTNFGAVGGVDALPRVSSLSQVTRGGLVATTALVAGRVLLFTTLEDAGFVDVAARPFNVGSPRTIALADFADAGAHLFFESGASSLTHWQLVEDNGRIDAIPRGVIALPSRPEGLAVSAGLRRVYASVGFGGVFEVDPLSMPPTVINVIDAGSSLDIVDGLAVYPQRDGGALLITTLAARDRYRVYQARPGSVAPLTDFIVTSADGGRQVRAGRYVDVYSGPFGPFDAGVLVVTDRLSLSGANYKVVPWPALANAVSPPLPIDLPFLAHLEGGALGADAGGRDGGALDGGQNDAGEPDGGRRDGGLDAGQPDGGRRDGGLDAGPSGGGSSGGGAAGGGRSSGGGGEEPPPPGCCSGAPSSSVLPLAGFFLWLRRFTQHPRRRGRRPPR